MEVLSFITSNIKVIDLFKEFINSYDKLTRRNENNDTIYYSKGDERNLEIYYHYLLNDVAKEFSYNYLEEDVSKIKSYFIDKELYIFDLSFKNENFLSEMIDDFKKYLVSNRKEHLKSDILLSHPLHGIIYLSETIKGAN